MSTLSESEKMTEPTVASALSISSQIISVEQALTNEKLELGKGSNHTSNGQVHRFTSANRDEYNTLLETGGMAYQD